MTGQQLKNSILQLAVQGKLVPQDPNDEPASVLLERIRAEKEQLIKEKKIKREKTPSFIFRGADNIPYEKVGDGVRSLEDEVPFEIPESWEWVRLGSISTYAETKVKINAQLADKNVWGLDLEDIEKGGRLINRHTVGERKAVGDKTFFAKGDILYSKLRPYLLKILVAPDEGICTPEIVPFSVYGKIVAEYIVNYLKSPYVDNYINSITYGVKMPRVGTDTMINLLVPLPPLAEQHRIVDKLNELEPYIFEYDKAASTNDELNHTFPNKLKNSILQMAVQGKLVPQNDSDEPASVLLERIRAEKQRLIKEGRIKKDKVESVIFRRDNSHYEKLGEIERCIDDEIPFEIPENWVWVRLGTMVCIQRGASPRPKGSPEYWSAARTPHHWIKISDITHHSIGNTLLDTDEFLTDLGATKSVFVDNDYLITAASGSLGKIAKLGLKGYIYDGLMCLCFKGISLEKDYIIIVIQTLVEYLLSVSTGTAWKNITTDVLKNLLIPLPPQKEQQRITNKCEELLQFCGKL